MRSFSEMRAAAAVTLIGFFGAALLRLLNLTLRWKIIGLKEEDRYWTTKDPRLMVFWHAQQLVLAWGTYLRCKKGRKSRRIAALISEHRDGRMIAEGMRFLGVDTVTGSSSRRGREALFESIDKLTSGSHVAMTPDGPKGPPQRLKGGIVRIAQRSGAHIYPVAMSAKWKWTFKSWDKMFLPKPFSPTVVVVGDTIAVPSELTSSEYAEICSRVENELNALTLRADAEAAKL